MKKNLILVGMMGTGKTTLGKIVAKKLGLSFFDTDHLVEKKNLMKIREIFEKRGEKFFRKEEEEVTLTCLRKKNAVIALGGGAFVNEKITKKILFNGIVVWLDLKMKNLNLRLKKNYKRPLLKTGDNLDTLEKIYSKRKMVYKSANHKIDCDSLGINKIVKKIIDIYEKY